MGKEQQTNQSEMNKNLKGKIDLQESKVRDQKNSFNETAVDDFSLS